MEDRRAFGNYRSSAEKGRAPARRRRDRGSRERPNLLILRFLRKSFISWPAPRHAPRARPFTPRDAFASFSFFLPSEFDDFLGLQRVCSV